MFGCFAWFLVVSIAVLLILSSGSLFWCIHVLQFHFLYVLCLVEVMICYLMLLCFVVYMFAGLLVCWCYDVLFLLMLLCLWFICLHLMYCSCCFTVVWFVDLRAFLMTWCFVFLLCVYDGLQCCRFDVLLLVSLFAFWSFARSVSVDFIMLLLLWLCAIMLFVWYCCLAVYAFWCFDVSCCCAVWLCCCFVVIPLCFVVCLYVCSLFCWFVFGKSVFRWWCFDVLYVSCFDVFDVYGFAACFVLRVPFCFIDVLLWLAAVFCCFLWVVFNLMLYILMCCCIGFGLCIFCCAAVLVFLNGVVPLGCSFAVLMFYCLFYDVDLLFLFKSVLLF